MTVTAKTFRQLALDMKTSVVAAYDDTPEAPPTPQVRIVHGIVPPHDCLNSVLISYELFQRSPTGLPVDRKAWLIQARFHVEVVRPWPMEPNLEQATEDQAMLLHDDATTLQFGLTDRWRRGTLFPSFPHIRAESVRLEDMRPREGQGGAAGYYWRVTVDMTGALTV